MGNAMAAGLPPHGCMLYMHPTAMLATNVCCILAVPDYGNVQATHHQHLHTMGFALHPCLAHHRCLGSPAAAQHPAASHRLLHALAQLLMQQQPTQSSSWQS
jgi:hypothetical protein